MKLTRKWFTLVEMLIVIVIIGILAAALIPRLTGIQGRARDTARKADLNSISQALATYQLDNNYYYNGTTNFGNASGMVDNFVSNGYLQSAPKDPQGHPYRYAVNRTTNPSVFALWAHNEWGRTNANWTGSAADQITNIGSLSGASSPSNITLCNGITQSTTVGNCQGNAGVHTKYVLVN